MSISPSAADLCNPRPVASARMQRARALASRSRPGRRPQLLHWANSGSTLVRHQGTFPNARQPHRPLLGRLLFDQKGKPPPAVPFDAESDRVGLGTRGYHSFVASGELITASCTAGWLDCIHGELWVLPDGLLRIRTSLTETLAHQNRRTVPDEPQHEEFSDSWIDAIVASHRTNLWIPAERIASANIHVGLMTGRANVRMKDGRRIKLLWLRSDRAERPLTTALASWGVPTSGPG